MLVVQDQAFTGACVPSCAADVVSYPQATVGTAGNDEHDVDEHSSQMSSRESRHPLDIVWIQSAVATAKNRGGRCDEIGHKAVNLTVDGGGVGKHAKFLRDRDVEVPRMLAPLAYSDVNRARLKRVWSANVPNAIEAVLNAVTYKLLLESR